MTKLQFNLHRNYAILPSKYPFILMFLGIFFLLLFNEINYLFFQEINNVRANAEERVKELEIDHKGVVARLEQQLSDHRQRSLATLQDRDQEIHRLTLELHEMAKLPTKVDFTDDKYTKNLSLTSYL